MTEGIHIREIMKYLPHRYPFILVDRVINLDEKKMQLSAIKNVTINEPFFTGHFPEHPVMPGVLIIEALAQACGILAYMLEQPKLGAKELFYLAGVETARFKQVVTPGDQLILEVNLLKSKQGISKFDTNAKVDGKIVCTAQMTSARKGN